MQQDDAPPATKDEQTHVQQVTGKFLWYARAVDGTMLTPLSAITAQQANPTSDTIKRVKQFLDYAALHRKSGMVLAVHSDALF